MWFLTFIFSTLFPDGLFGNRASTQSIERGPSPNPLPFDISLLSTVEVAAMSPERVAGLTTRDIVALTTEQIQALQTHQIASLTSAQVAVLETADIVALTTAQIPALSTSAIAALITSQVVAVENVDLTALTTAQVVALTTTAIQALTTAQGTAFTIEQKAVLSEAQNAVFPRLPTIYESLSTTEIAALIASQVRVLLTDDIVALTTLHMPALTTAAVAALRTDHIRALETQDFVAMTTAQLQVFTSAQTAALTTTQIEGLSTLQIGAFTTLAYQFLTPGTPIVLDLNGDGVRTLSIDHGVKFDLFADGQSIRTGWVSSGDGLLVLDRNADGVISDGSELFGEATRLQSGERALDGYHALRELDSNQDGVISSLDDQYADLQVWVDSNSDGLSQRNELWSLEALQIEKVSLTTSIGTTVDNGNLLGLTSTYQTTGGEVRAAADVWFAADRYGVAESVEPLSSEVKTTTPKAVIQSDLRSRVSSLAQAIGSFGEMGSGVLDLKPASRLNTPGEVVATQPAPLVVVSSLADAMQQFDTNATSNIKPLSAAVPASRSLSLPGLSDPSASTLLVQAGGK